MDALKVMINKPFKKKKFISLLLEIEKAINILFDFFFFSHTNFLKIVH